MGPCKSQPHAADQGSRDAKALGYGHIGLATISYFKNKFIGEFAVGVGFTMGMSQLVVAIARVVSRGSKKQMIRVDAGGNVARVTNHLPSRNFSLVGLVGETVSAHRFLADAHLPVTSGSDAAVPNPAARVGINDITLKARPRVYDSGGFSHDRLQTRRLRLGINRRSKRWLIPLKTSTKTIGIAALFAVCGCATKPPEPVIVTKTVMVAVPVQCRVTLPAEPVLPSHGADLSGDAYALAALSAADLNVLQAALLEWSAAAKACASP
jgi:hypothetical protein